jgi:hypothetical protein
MLFLSLSFKYLNFLIFLMALEYNKRKTLVEIDLSTWARVKHFATIKKISVNDAVQFLLGIGLSNCGYNILKKQIMVSPGESLTASTQNAPSFEIQ